MPPTVTESAAHPGDPFVSSFLFFLVSEERYPNSESDLSIREENWFYVLLKHALGVCTTNPNKANFSCEDWARHSDLALILEIRKLALNNSLLWKLALVSYPSQDLVDKYNNYLSNEKVAPYRPPQELSSHGPTNPSFFSFDNKHISVLANSSEIQLRGEPFADGAPEARRDVVFITIDPNPPSGPKIFNSDDDLEKILNLPQDLQQFQIKFKYCGYNHVGRPLSCRFIQGWALRCRSEGCGLGLI